MSLERDIRLMRNLPILEELSDDQLRLIAFSAENRRLPEGAELFRDGQRADAAYVVAEGDIVLSQETEDGETISEHCGPGTLIGGRSLLIETLRPARAVAAANSEVIMIRRALFHRMMNEYPDIAARLHARLAADLESASGEYRRIAARLDALGE